MITNKKLYDMIAEQMSNGNDALREQLESQIITETNQVQTMAQALADRQHSEINALSEQMNFRLDALQNQLKLELGQHITEQLTWTNQSLTQKYDAETQILKTELSEKINQATGEQSAIVIQQLTQDYDEKIEFLRKELSEKIDAKYDEIIQANAALAQGITNIQKDTAIIMKTLQLILTNMMLNTVETNISEGKNFKS